MRAFEPRVVRSSPQLGRRNPVRARVVGSLIAAIALCANVGCGEDDDPSPSTTTGSGTNQGTGGTNGSSSGAGTPMGTTTTTGA